MNTSMIFPAQQARRRAEQPESPSSASASFDRRHDLDALRAIAMLLGIVLHVALSFAPIPWTVQDSQQSPMFDVLFAFIHGFRMPLFFMLSGFFTAMLWRKRGLKSLVYHRFRRIFLPLVIGCLTIVPAMWAVSYLASRPSPGAPPSTPLFAAVVSGDVASVRAELAKPDNGINEHDSHSGATPLCSAVFIGRSEIAELLVDADADVNLPDRNLATPLHIAAFMGRADEAGLLLGAGADVTARDAGQRTPSDHLQTDFGTTNFIAISLGVPVDEDELLAGRKEIAGMLKTTEYLGADTAASPQAPDWAGLRGLLFQLPVFMHLWFLWFLCWLVGAFLVYAMIVRAVNLRSLPRWFVCSPINLLWLIPLTLLPQLFMSPGSFGPDASIGLLPLPSVFCFYAVFFFFGALYWDMEDAGGQLGRRWYVSLPLALLIVFPLGLDLVSGTFGVLPRFEDGPAKLVASGLLQVTFAWLMTFGLIGLFRQVLSQESRTLRYISDSSYWLYLFHLPWVILAQWSVRELQLPAVLKFTAITVVVSLFLMLTYEYGVRYTMIGRLLNGARTRTK